MKKVFISISAVIMVVVIALIISLSQIKKKVTLEYDNPSVIRVFDESTNPTKNEGYKSSDEQYSEILKKLNNMSKMTLIDRLLKLKTLDVKLELSKDGTFAKYSTDLKSKNLVVEMDFAEEQDLVVYDNGHTRTISFWCLAFVVKKDKGLTDIVVYYSTTNSSDARDESYAKCEPILIKGYADKLIEFVDTL